MNRNIAIALVLLALLAAAGLYWMNQKSGEVPGIDAGETPSGEASSLPGADGTTDPGVAGAPEGADAIPSESGSAGTPSAPGAPGAGEGSENSAESPAASADPGGAVPSGATPPGGVIAPVAGTSGSAAPVAGTEGSAPGTPSGASTSDAGGIPGRAESVAGGGRPAVLAPGSNADSALKGTAPGTTATALPPDVDPSRVGGQVIAKRPLPDGVDGYRAMEGDDGAMPAAKKAVTVPKLAGIENHRVWLVASDLKNVKGARKGGAPFEVGLPEGSKASAWKNRSGAKFGDGIRVKGSSTGTFVKGLRTSTGNWDAVALCAPGARECVNTQASQIRFGLDVNHADHWLSGADKTGKSTKGGSSFTVLFVAARASAAANPILEHQNGEAGATRGPFLGWVGPDLVGSIHGTQGIVGMNAAAMPSPYVGGPTAPVVPVIYSMRFDRKKSDLRIFQVGEKISETTAQKIDKGDGPDNDQYATIALGSKNPGVGGATYVFEAAAFPRALTDSEMCAIHKEWNKKYALKVPNRNIKPCSK